MLKQITGLLVLTGITGVAIAAAPVSSLKTLPLNQMRAAQTNLTTQQRLTQQENQISNLNTQVDDLTTLKTSITALRGKQETMAHQMTQLDTQLTLLTNRVGRLEAAASIIKPSFAREKVKPVNGETAKSSDFEAYQVAYQLIEQKQYKKAEAALLSYVTKYPKSPYLTDAQYWLGELYLVMGKADSATQQFRAVISVRDAMHRPDAMRELGTIFQSNGDSAHAKQMFQSVIKNYPGTIAAEQAKQQLAEMK